MKRIAVVAFCLVVFGALQAAAQSGGERLIVPPYPGNPAWKNITDKANAQQKMMEWIPANQNENAISDILTEQVFYTLKNTDPSVFVTNFLGQVGQACEQARVNGPKRQTQNGYRVAYGQAYCTHQKGTSIDADIFLKAIGGSDGLYVVQREFRRPTQPGETAGAQSFSKDQIGALSARMAAMAAADRYLASAVQLCPPPGKGPACPAKPKP